MNAAVADFRPINITSGKIKKNKMSLSLNLKPTVDILNSIKDKTSACLVGFALETENKEQNAIKKMKEKNLSYVVLNTPNGVDQGFEVDTNRVTIYKKDGQKFQSDIDTKSRISRFLWKTILG